MGAELATGVIVTVAAHEPRSGAHSKVRRVPARREPARSRTHVPNCSSNLQAKHRAIRKDNLGELRSLRSPPALSSPADAQEFWGSSPCFRLIRGGIGPSRLAVASLLT